MMKHTRVASYIPPSPYTKNSPSMKTRNELSKKNSISGESSKNTKLVQADLNVRPHLQNSEIDKKYSPLSLDRKGEFSSNLYQLAKGIDKDKQTYSKLYKTKETQQKKVVQKSSSRPASGNASEKLSIYQYVQSKSKRPEDQKTTLNLSNQASSRISSRIIIPEDNNDSMIQKVNETNALSTKRYLGGTPNDTSQSKIAKPKVTPGHHKTGSTVVRGTQNKTPSTNGTKQLNIFQPSTNNLSFHEVINEYSKTPVPRSGEHAKVSNAANNFNDALAQKLKLALQGLQGDLNNAKHRRGLSSGQTPIFIDQQALQERAEKIEKMEKAEKVVEKVKPIELAPADPQQEQDEYYEKFFHSDKMTFDFEKQIISQRHKMQQNISCTASATPTNKKPATAAVHTRTRSIEDPNSLLPTKASSRWNTKRSSVGDEMPAGGRERFNLIEQISDLDRTDFDKEELRKYLRG